MYLKVVNNSSNRIAIAESNILPKSVQYNFVDIELSQIFYLVYNKKRVI